MREIGARRDAATTAVPATLEHELRLIREAIAMVASGGAPRVTVAGIHFGERLLGPARGLALGAGVRVVPLWTAGDEGPDIAVERMGDA